MSMLPSSFQSIIVPDVDTLDIKSEVLDPITITDNLIVFQLPKTGTLDAGSMIQLGGVLTDASQEGQVFYPIDTGINAFIQSATLKIGNKVLTQTQDHAYLSTMMRKFKTPDERAFKDMPRQGTCGDRFAVNSDARVVYRDMEVDSTGNLEVPEYLKPTSSDSTTPVFSIMLSELFSAFKNQQIPLFAIKDNVYIEIVLNRQYGDISDIGKICCVNESLSGTGAQVNISKPNVKFLYDGLYYSDVKSNALMEQALSPKGLTYLYEDVLETFASVGTGIPNQPQLIEREIALSGKSVRSILVSDRATDDNTVLQGIYVSRDQLKPSTVNLRINDQRMYDRGLTSAPRKYDELSFAVGQPLQVPSQLYSFDVDTDATGTVNQNSFFIGEVEGYTLCDADSVAKLTPEDIRATSHFNGFDLTKGSLNTFDNATTVGVKPILFEKTYDRGQDADNQSRELRIFSSVLKTLTLRNGVAMVSA